MQIVTQPSLFSADLVEPRPADLGGLLAAHGQVASGADGTRLSILLVDQWRAEALLRECKVRDVPAEVAAVPASDQHRGGTGGYLLRTGWNPELAALAAQWTRGAVKSTPEDLDVAVGLLRCWVLAAGKPTPHGFLLGLDPHRPEMYTPLAAACARAGIAGALVGPVAGGPAVRVVGRRRLMRLTEMLGTPPAQAPKGAFGGTVC